MARILNGFFLKVSISLEVVVPNDKYVVPKLFLYHTIFVCLNRSIEKLLFVKRDRRNKLPSSSSNGWV